MEDALQRLVEALENDASLLLPDQLHRRLHALDVLDLHFAGASGELRCAYEDWSFCCRARNLSVKLEALNGVSYEAIRTEILRGEGAAALLRRVPSASALRSGAEPIKGAGYDFLDELIRGVLAFDEPDSQPATLERELVFYQPTPARHIFRLIQEAALTADDVLIDLGSGLGHVPLLVAVCTSARSVGIELERSYIPCARQCAEQLGLRRAMFLHGDARTADLSGGTVFYLHTPFTGSVMRSVLDRLRNEAAKRSIRICTYGPCTAAVAEERWLQATVATDPNGIAIFLSRV